MAPIILSLEQPPPFQVDEVSEGSSPSTLSMSSQASPADLYDAEAAGYGVKDKQKASMPKSPNPMRDERWVSTSKVTREQEKTGWC